MYTTEVPLWPTVIWSVYCPWGLSKSRNMLIIDRKTRPTLQ